MSNTKNKLQTVEISRDKPFSKKLQEVLESLSLSQTIKVGFEENDLTVAELAKLKKELKGIKLIPTQGRVEQLRTIKREDEIENIKLAAKLTDQCFDFILGKLKPGITEEMIAWEIESFIRKYGAQLAFSPIVAFGKNTSQPHYQTSDGRLQTRDILLIDFGAKLNGYCADMTRVVFVGKPKEEWKRAYLAVLKAQKRALDALSTGERSGAALDRLARSTIEKAGFIPYSHSLGHAVGLAIHEAPRLTIKKDVILKPGMVFSVEPAIYSEGDFGIRIEDLALLKEDGIEILSKSPKNLTK